MVGVTVGSLGLRAGGSRIPVPNRLELGPWRRGKTGKRVVETLRGQNAGSLGGRGPTRPAEQGKILRGVELGKKGCFKMGMSNVQYKVVFCSVNIFPHSFFS